MTVFVTIKIATYELLFIDISEINWTVDAEFKSSKGFTIIYSDNSPHQHNILLLNGKAIMRYQEFQLMRIYVDTNITSAVPRGE